MTGNGVDSWDCKPKVFPKVHTGMYLNYKSLMIMINYLTYFLMWIIISERNPVTGEVYTIISPATTPTKPSKLSFPKENGTATPQLNGNHVPVINGNLTNGQA